MITRVRSVVLFQRLLGLASPAIAASYPPPSKADCGPVPTASLPQKTDGEVLQERDRLQARLDAAAPRSEAHNSIWADLCRVKQECLRRGI